MGGKARVPYDVELVEGLDEEQLARLAAKLAALEARLEDGALSKADAIVYAELHRTLKDLDIDVSIDVNDGVKKMSSRVAELSEIVDLRLSELRNIRGAREAGGVELPSAFQIASGNPTVLPSVQGRTPTTIAQTVQRVLDSIPLQVREALRGKGQVREALRGKG